MATPGVPGFVASLYEMLTREDPAVLCWTADGLAFEIRDQTRLAATVLPRYFRHAKYPSFQRQLNYFGFKKWSKQRAPVCTYSCAWFSRDAPQHLSRVSRRPRPADDPKSLRTEKPVRCEPKGPTTFVLPTLLPSDGLATFDKDLDDLWQMLEFP
ncbi:HSF-type DNA-binding protein [Achlya hypogyna]|uniref:HSF-type DNA-binding protein n=1 Tax=Achlya hypogyna TaxID=1202772 RepID=A0A1V9Z458_ACHHY|nr:HSF-type DNA-binding protein [Achlya hypogyna]